jgi:hypothetical protein
MRKLSERFPWLLDSSLIVLLFASVVAVTYIYVSSEHVFYWSDYSGYQNITHDIAARFHESPLAAARAVAGSMLLDYNALFTIPILPFVLLFGDSRIVFEIALAVVYLVPFTLVLGLIAVTLIPGQPRAVFYSTVAFALLTPFTWVPTLRGYPDTGAACLVGLAVWTYVLDTRLQRCWQVPLIGCLLALAMLFRRHFAYDGLAFLAAMVCMALGQFVTQARQQPREAWRGLLTRGLKIGLTGGVTLVVLFTVGLPFMYHVLTQNVTALYASYIQPVGVWLQWFVWAYGWVICLAAVIGIGIGVFARVLQREAAAFFVLFGGLVFLEWMLMVRQVGEHYTLHFTPAIVLGLAALVWTIWRKTAGLARGLVVGVGGVFLLANLVVGLTPDNVAIDQALSPLFAGKSSPLTRPNYAEVANLIGYLRDLAPGGEPIYVAAASDILNKDLVINAERILYGWDESRLRVLQSPNIDSRDFYPLETLMQAQYVIVVEPFQQQMGAERQRVVEVVYDLFTGQQELARDFVRLPRTFPLADGAIASIYARTRPTTIATAMRTLRVIQAYVPLRPGGQPDWMILSPMYPVSVEKNRDSTYQVATPLLSPEAPTSPTLLYLGASPRTGSLMGDLTLSDPRCPGVILTIASIDASDQTIDLASVTYRPNDSPAFAMAFTKPESATLLLRIKSINGDTATDQCSLVINRLELVGD